MADLVEKTRRTSTRVIQEDAMQEQLAAYASELNFASLTVDVVHATKRRVVDALGGLVGGFFGGPCKMARNLAFKMPQPDGATIFGTRHRTTPDMAAFVNGTTARYVELNDTYHQHGSNGGHASDVVMPVLTVADHAHASGKDTIAAVALAYEIFLRFSDATKIAGFDNTTFCGLATAIASAKLLGLSQTQIHHAISMALIPNNPLNQTRSGELSMWKAVAAGQAARAGVFAALLARENLEGPHLPFEGKNGWLDHVAHNRFELAEFGGNGRPFKIEDVDVIVKPRASCGTTISSILAAEDAYKSINHSDEIKAVTVEVYRRAKVSVGSGEHRWDPINRENADHSIPYVVAATLHEGTITPRQLDDAHLADPAIRELMAKIEVVENPEFTKDYEKVPVEHRTRVTVVHTNGTSVVGETGGAEDDLATPRSDTYISEKFTMLAQEYLGMDQVRSILGQLWSLEEMADAAYIPGQFVI